MISGSGLWVLGKLPFGHLIGVSLPVPTFTRFTTIFNSPLDLCDLPPVGQSMCISTVLLPLLVTHNPLSGTSVFCDRCDINQISYYWSSGYMVEF